MSRKTSHIVPYVLVTAAVALGFCQSSSAQSSLSSAIDSALAKQAVPGVVGVSVAEVTSGGTRIVYSRGGATPLIPASNMKVLTSSAGLAVLGADFRFRTVLAMRGQDLVLIGDGDPTLGDPEYHPPNSPSSTPNPNSPAVMFDAWANQLKAQGITQVRNVVVDDSIFDTQFVHPNWPADQLDRDYVAQVAGVNLGFNCISVAVSGGPAGSAAAARLVPATAYFSLSNTARQGTQSALGLGRVPGTNNLRLSGQRPAKGGDIFVNVTLHDPPAYAATLLSERLKRAGIQVTGVPAKSRDMRGLYMSAQGQFKNMLVHETPLAGVLARINKDSANLYAESLLKRLGVARSNQPGGWDNGRAAAASFLASIAVPADHYAIDDGCGLSRQNRLSPEALVRLHAHNLRSAYRDAFLASLSVGGEDGTLRRRFTGDLDGRVFGKTGYIRGVSTLSGVLKTKSGKWYAFAVMHNELPGSVGGAKAAQDRVVAAIDAHGN